MPKIPNKRPTIVKKPLPKPVFEYGVDTFRCPECNALHHYPFRDGCHNDACGYSGELVKQSRKG